MRYFIILSVIDGITIHCVYALILGRPVRFHATLEQCMETFGRRADYIMDYKVGALTLKNSSHSIMLRFARTA